MAAQAGFINSFSMLWDRARLKINAASAAIRGAKDASMLTEFSLEGKAALITGAGRGIGTGIADVFAEAGAAVAVNALSETHVKPFAEKLAARTGAKVIAIAGDCTTPAGANALIEAAARAIGPLDILVNNLGDAIPARFARVREGKTETIADDTIGKIIDLNLMAAIYCTRAAAPAMLARRRGKIINISSIGGVEGSPGLSLYAAAKHAIGGLTRSLALEWAKQGVQVNAIAPGLYPDPNMMSPEQFAAAKERVAARVPMGREGKFRDVGPLALYLASSASDYMTGQIISIDGGMTA
jgi:NAD(P)-dependent dehydrogenase (short-subunit alcohol dehydrogenase family)